MFNILHFGCNNSYLVVVNSLFVNFKVVKIQGFELSFLPLKYKISLKTNSLNENKNKIHLYKDRKEIKLKLKGKMNKNLNLGKNTFKVKTFILIKAKLHQ